MFQEPRKGILYWLTVAALSAHSALIACVAVESWGQTP